MRRIPWQFSAVAALACAALVGVGIAGRIAVPWYPLGVGLIGLLNAGIATAGWLARYE
jgi:hypothetical protein